MGIVKTTLDIEDELLERAKRHALRSGRPLGPVVEEGLRRVLPAKAPVQRYRLPDISVGQPGGVNPLEACSWDALRDAIYGERRPG